MGRVGGGFSDELRASLLQQLAERAVESDYLEVNSDQVGYPMIEPGLVVELSCLDVVSLTSQGSSIDRMVLDWHASQRRWEGVCRLPRCSRISPQFVRLRDYKQATPEHVRLNSYVLHRTDYSPNRESPLNHEIQVSSSEAQIRKLFAAWKQQVFVGGWKEVGPAGP